MILIGQVFSICNIIFSEKLFLLQAEQRVDCGKNIAPYTETYINIDARTES